MNNDTYTYMSRAQGLGRTISPYALVSLLRTRLQHLGCTVFISAHWTRSRHQCEPAQRISLTSASASPCISLGLSVPVPTLLTIFSPPTFEAKRDRQADYALGIKRRILSGWRYGRLLFEIRCLCIDWTWGVCLYREGGREGRREGGRLWHSLDAERRKLYLD